jgi:hypothetical protein
MGNIIPLIDSNVTFTPYYFYNDFIKRVSNYYQTKSIEPIQFRLVSESDLESVESNYFIDPISLPLLLSLSQQLKNYHKSPIKLHLSNTAGTIGVLEFLHRADFFYLVGDNVNPNYPAGKKIFNFNEGYLGGFKGKIPRSEHKIRCYSLEDDNLIQRTSSIKIEDEKRDYLVEYYTYKVKEHFANLLYENELTSSQSSLFIEILAELITNGVLHSRSDAFALMFSDRFKTKFSISDNGIGLMKSLEGKDNSEYYKKFELLNELSSNFPIKLSNLTKESLLAIFETLYYSMLKERRGLFDLMCNVVLNSSGYFRLHNHNAQIIVSSRMKSELSQLYNTRQSIIKCYTSKLFEKIHIDEFEIQMAELVIKSKEQMLDLAYSIFNKFTQDTRFSSIRIFEVRFRGVHVEVEMPNSNSEL